MIFYDFGICAFFNNLNYTADQEINIMCDLIRFSGIRLKSFKSDEWRIKNTLQQRNIQQ